jgi:hypothetical protein
LKFHKQSSVIPTDVIAQQSIACVVHTTNSD